MKHAREDYNRIQDPLGKIPEDEPVMLFRAQDEYARFALMAYVQAIRLDDQATAKALKVADIVDEFCIEFENWTDQKQPDL